MTETQRWQLNRAGITNVYQYENEILTFRGGRLLLRGINGSGKSTAMNMLLPFLLTGRTRGIDAAGEQTGILKSWMLSGRDERQPVGYLWVEFECADLNTGTMEHVVIGCGIKANRSSDTVTTWWFVTRRRPGIDFDLLEQHVPLSLDALRAVVEPDPVFTQDRRADYRREVARCLFGGADIESFLNLINTVRSPRVGDRVDVELPQYLVSAMPGLSETALNEAARPLDDLDEHRRNVADLGKTEVALAAIVGVYRDYALTQLHAEQNRAKRMSSSIRQARKQLESKNEEFEVATLAEAQASERRSMLEHQSVQFEQEIQALQRSSAYTEGQQLEDLRRHVLSLESRSTRDQASHEEQQQRQPAFNKAVVNAEHLSDTRLSSLSEEVGVLMRQVSEAGVVVSLPGITPVPRVELPGTDAGEPLEVFDSATVETQLKTVSGAAATRTADVDTAREQIKRVAAVSIALRDAQSAQQQAAETTADTHERFEAGRQDLSNARAAWVEAVSKWVQRCQRTFGDERSMQGSGAEEPLVLAQYEPSSGADLHAQRATLYEQASCAYDEQRSVVLVTQTQVQERERDLQEAMQVLEQLQARTEPAVPELPWQQRRGPSFADVVDFKDSLDIKLRARLEAAMEASGLLYASIERSGARLQSGDLLINSGAGVEQPLSTYLGVSVPDNLSDDIDKVQVQRILDSIGTQLTSSCATVVTIDGQFRVGALSGRHEKVVAEYVGAIARRARLEKLRADAAMQVEQSQHLLEQIRQALSEATAYERQLLTNRDELPALTPIDTAQAVAAALEEELEKARERLQLKDKALVDAERRLSVTDDECQRICRSLGLPFDAPGIEKIERTLKDILTQVQSSIRLASGVGEATQEWAMAVERWRIARQDLKKAKEQWQLSRQDWESEQARLATLESTLGASYREVVEQIETSERALAETKRSIPTARDENDRAIRVASDAQNAVRNSTAALAQLENECISVHARFTKVLSVPGLLGAVVLSDSTQPMNDSVASTPHEGEDIDLSLPQTTADAQGLDKLANHIGLLLPALIGEGTRADGVRISLRQRRNTLGAGWDAEDHQPDTDLPMSISVTGPLGQMPLADSVTTVRKQLSNLQALLTEKQDQALRNLLQGLIAREVAERMFEAKRLIERMNVRLHSVTTSHGIGVRLRWRRSPELDDSTANTVDILGKTPDLRSEEEEAQLRVALAQALEEARRLEPDAAYRQLIAQVFDYRRWHEMGIMLRRGEDPEKRLTRKTPLSEGEKKLVSYLPLFAAVAAACDALCDVGGGQVPRFLLLDDAFAKVSEDNHAALFGLLVSLDLDFIATSERLWGTHASVPALAITEVVRDTALGAILLEHSYWDGHTLTLPTSIDVDADTWGDSYES
ncbi:MAG: TIGR02680 family protein [Granulosicoccus sp.]